MKMKKRKIIELIEEIMEVDEGTIRGGEVLESLDGWDSLKVVMFIATVDENYNITLSPQKIADANTIGDLVELVNQQALLN
jgi:acyl carrier protein